MAIIYKYKVFSQQNIDTHYFTIQVTANILKKQGGECGMYEWMCFRELNERGGTTDCRLVAVVYLFFLFILMLT